MQQPQHQIDDLQNAHHQLKQKAPSGHVINLRSLSWEETVTKCVMYAHRSQAGASLRPTLPYLLHLAQITNIKMIAMAMSIDISTLPRSQPSRLRMGYCDSH